MSIRTIEEALIEATTMDIVLELHKRGFRAVPSGAGRELNWNRTMDKEFNEEAFKWEAAHKIGGMIEPKHLEFTTSKTGLMGVMRGALFFR